MVGAEVELLIKAQHVLLETAVVAVVELEVVQKMLLVEAVLLRALQEALIQVEEAEAVDIPVFLQVQLADLV
jgi:hypothetical protein